MATDTVILFAGIFAEATAVGLLLYRKTWRSFPVFCIYFAWTLASDIANYFILSKFPSHIYSRIYFKEMAPDFILQFAVLVELAWSVLRPVRASLPRSSAFLLGMIIAVAGLVIWPLASGAVPPNVGPDGRIYVHLEETAAILRIVCFLVMASFSQLLSIGWRDRELQIASGLGFFSIVSLIVAVLHTHQDVGAPLYSLLDRVVSCSYLGSVLYWVLCFSRKEQERREFSPQMQRILVQMGGGARTDRIVLTGIPPKHATKRD